MERGGRGRIKREKKRERGPKKLQDRVKKKIDTDTEKGGVGHKGRPETQ